MAYPSTTLWPSTNLYPSDDIVVPVAPVARPIASGSIVLCDFQGEELAELEVDHTLRFERSRAWSCKFKLSYDQLGATELLSQLAAGLVPQLRAYRRKAVVFSGYWSPQQEQADGTEEEGITCEFRSPFSRLENRYLQEAFSTSDGQGNIVWALINASGSAPGLLRGVIESTSVRTVSYSIGQQVAQAIINLADIEGGFYFTETPLDPTQFSGALAALDIWSTSSSAFGRDLSRTVQFEYGELTAANVSVVQRTVGLPVNKVILTGGTPEGTSSPLLSIADETTSQTRVGVYAVSQTASDIVDQNLLDARARGLLRPDFVQQVSFQPEVGNGPQPLDDYWIGDTVAFYADQGAFKVDTDVEITAIELDRDGSGVEMSHKLEFGNQTVQSLVPVRRGRSLVFRDPSRS